MSISCIADTKQQGVILAAKRRLGAPTQADVARRAGVSQATVSAVVNGRAASHRIPPETERMVRDAVRDLGYAANPAARSLKGKRNRILGVHTFEAVFPIASRDFYHEFLIGVEEQAVAEGYDLLLFTSTERPDGQRQLYSDGSNRLNVADGSVLLGVAHDHSDLARLSREGYPFVHIGRREVPGAEIAWVSADYAAATRDAVARLVELGHRRVGYLGITHRVEAVADRESGYRAACAELGIPALPVMMNAHELTVEWFDHALAHGMTAFLAEDESFAGRLEGFATERGLAIPEHVSVVVLRDAAGGPRPGVPWSCVGIPRREIGREAVRLLVQTLSGPAAHRDDQVLLPCSPPEATTVAAVPADADGGAR
ncbi:LacI family DNA-binding transcriptional regulator [Streptomyces sp. PT12]|uniref:LacI family DNA-binding transcriptional regulator n=1 Tax=Streptomyces sp. PT12 TaxID=1510197 RepID=UPI000DE4439E|nr:LacI family DNA-binding transcriptional regulator [Streptomyces sp. PT12]RBM18525.1 LacI family transcriptional regulator [Streptomyces sp. PT12]